MNIVAAADLKGTFLAISSTSHGAQKAGIDTKHIIGHKIWEFAQPDTKDTARNAFCDAVIDGKRVEYQTSSMLGGREEHWHTTLMPCPGAEVVLLVREIPAPDLVLTEADRLLLKRLASDMGPKEIAQATGEKEGTVNAQCSRLRDKMNCQTTHGLIAFAARVGLLD